jgi:hypothetical protein
MAINDIFKLSVVGRFPNGQEWVNVHYYKQLVTFILTQPEQGLVDDFQATVEADLLQGMNGDMFLDQYEVRQVSGGLAALDVPVGLTGTGGSGDMLSPMDCPLVSWRTGLIGRANRGRTYFPSILESLQANGVISAAGLTFYQTVADDHITLKDALTGLQSDWSKVIFHTDASDSPVVTTGLVRNQLATQRRRRT